MKPPVSKRSTKPAFERYPKSKEFPLGTVLLLIIALYLAASHIRYRILNPEMTETQLMLHYLDILLWQ